MGSVVVSPMRSVIGLVMRSVMNSVMGLVMELGQKQQSVWLTHIVDQQIKISSE